MGQSTDRSSALTYPLRTAARLTGLSPDVLRAWERRYRVVVPRRTPGGTRRYSAADLERLRLVKAAVDAGQRIGRVAALDAEDLVRSAAGRHEPLQARIDEVLEALARLDNVEAQRLLALHLSTLGPTRFAIEIASPLARQLGIRWASAELSVAAEHLATAVLRSLLGAALLPTTASVRGPRILIATPPGERHELGALMAALVALGGGANPLFLGPDVPTDDVLAAAEAARVRVVALGIVSLPLAEAVGAVRTIRQGLPDDVRVWIGGAGAGEVLREVSPARKPDSLRPGRAELQRANGISRRAEPRVPARTGIEWIEDLEHLERRLSLLISAVE